LVEWLDLTFSLDNILATVALSRETWVVIVGVCLSILAMRFVAGIFLHWLERLPILWRTAYLLGLFVGAKMPAGVWGFDLGEVETFMMIFAIVAGSLIYERLKASSASPARVPRKPMSRRF